MNFILSRKKISYLFLPVMVIYTFSSVFACMKHVDSLSQLHSTKMRDQVMAGCKQAEKQETIIKYFYSNSKIIDEYDGREMSSYLFGKQRILRTVSAINQKQSTKVQWLISNGKDVSGEVDSYGQYTGINYTPYGRTTTLSSVVGGSCLVAGNNRLKKVDFRQQVYYRSPVSSSRNQVVSNLDTNPFQYSGYYLDSESNLYYLNARFYFPELMRFVNRDSYDLSNHYNYCSSDPINATDPTGHISKLWSYLLGGLSFGLGLFPGAWGSFCVGDPALCVLGWGGVGCGVASNVLNFIPTHSRKQAKILNYTALGVGLLGCIAVGFAMSRAMNLLADMRPEMRNGLISAAREGDESLQTPLLEQPVEPATSTVTEGDPEVTAEGDQDGNNCCICYEDIGDHPIARTDNCDHGRNMHDTCLETWRNGGHNTCPVCREPLRSEIENEGSRRSLAAIVAGGGVVLISTGIISAILYSFFSSHKLKNDDSGKEQINMG